MNTVSTCDSAHRIRDLAFQMMLKHEPVTSHRTLVPSTRWAAEAKAFEVISKEP